VKNKKLKRLAIIPARIGSKRIPKKNIRDFCGRPMISYILNTAKKSKLFDVIHVSTESNEIKQVVEKLGFQVPFMRSEHLAGDSTPIVPVLKDVTDKFESMGQYFDEIWLLMACSPLIEDVDLIKAAKLFEMHGGKNPIIAVSEYPVPIEWAFTSLPNGRLSPVQPGMFAVRSQDLEKKYFDAGTFCVFPFEKIKFSEGAGSDKEFVGYVISKDKAIDIDDEADWKFAEAMFLIKNK